MIKYVIVLSWILIFGNLYNECDSEELHLSSTSQTENLDFSNGSQLTQLVHGTLSKCYCDADHFWHQNTCQEAETWIDIVIFSPFNISRIQTSQYEGVSVNTFKCHEDEVSIEIQSGYLTNEGLWNMETGDTWQRFCVENVQKKSGDIIMISSICLPKELKLPICCSSATAAYDKENFDCGGLGSKNIDIPIDMGSKTLTGIEILNYRQKIPEDAKKEEVIIHPNDNSSSLIFQGGQIMLKLFDPMSDFDAYYRPSEYCIILNYNEPHSAYIWWPVVAKEPKENCEWTMHWILLPLLIISAIFLVAILVLHAILPNLRKSTGSKITICHLSSLLAGFCLLIIMHIPQVHHCKVYGPMFQMSFLATFFWLNVMCFDIWRKLRCECPAGESAQSSVKRFRLYSLYAWGCPLLIGLITVVMDNTQSLEGVEGLILPGFGKEGNCWFQDKKAAYAYYFGIIAALMVLNLFFFLWVFVLLVNANCVYNEVLNRNHADNKRVWIYLKIFCLMGVTWICEFISWQEGTCTIWIATDIINALRGLILFVTFFGNRKSANKIWERVTSLNATLNTRLSRSMNNLRKLSLIPSMTLESNIDSRRASEIVNPADLPHKVNSQSHEGQRKRNASSPIIVNVESRRDSNTSTCQIVEGKPPSCPASLSSLKPEDIPREHITRERIPSGEAKEHNKRPKFYI